MSLWIARNMGQCVESFCNKRWDDLKAHISSFGSVTLGAALLNALLKYFVNVTALDVRQRLTRSVHKAYVRRVVPPQSTMCGHPVLWGLQIHEQHGVLPSQQGRRRQRCDRERRPAHRR